MLSIEDEKRDAALDFFNYTGLKIDHSDELIVLYIAQKKLIKKHDEEFIKKINESTALLEQFNKQFLAIRTEILLDLSNQNKQQQTEINNEQIQQYKHQSAGLLSELKNLKIFFFAVLFVNLVLVMLIFTKII
jgi:hypothetical protein